MHARWSSLTPVGLEAFAALAGVTRAEIGGMLRQPLIARVVADVLESFDLACEWRWIAKRDEAVVGSVFVVFHPERAGVARLRLLYVEPSARGLGIGRRLVGVCPLLRRVGPWHAHALRSVASRMKRV